MAEKLTGKRISILGDSVSTYRGVSDNSEYNSALCSNATYYPRGNVTLEDTYWIRIIDRLGLTLCVNNSWSGSFATRHVPYNGNDFSAVLSPAVERVKYLADRQGEKPDIIVIFVGLNDLGTLISHKEFGAAYREMLGEAKTLYPEAKIFCVGMPDRDPLFYESTLKYNEHILTAVSELGENFFYVDLCIEGLKRKDYIDKSLDGLHPAVSGMSAIAEAISAAILKAFE